jgi:DNA-binding transcriptional LysR family regulator
MKTQTLKAFILVVSQGSLLAAARVLELSEPAISRLIRELEAECGLLLFDSSNRQLTLTDEGAKFHREVQRVLEGIDQLPSLAADIKQGQEEFLSVVAMPRAASGIVAPAVAEFTRANPRVHVKIDIRSRSEGEVWFGSARYDIGIGSLPIFHPKIIQARHVQVPVMCMVPTGHRLSRLNRALSPDDIAYESMITQSRTTLSREQMEAWFRSANCQLCHTIEVDSPELLGSLVAEGAGISLVDSISIAGLASERYALIPIENTYLISYGTLWFCPPEKRKQKATLLSELFEKHALKWARDVHEHA